MDTTPNLVLPYLMAAQAQKHVTHNEAIRMLDAIVQLSVLERNVAAPPGAPENGDRYIIGAGASGDWSGLENQVAAFQDGAWAYFQPREGWLAWVSDEDLLLIWDGSASIGTGVGGGVTALNPADGGLVGFNATADLTNRLFVKSDAILFSHDDVTPGTGDAQVKINKDLASNTASLLFQSNFSGRAEFGTTGDDDFHVKVSPDNTTWHEAIVVDKDTVEVSFPNTSLGGGGGGSGGGGTNPNILINGDFQINQRAFGGGALAAGSYGHDRFKAAAGGANYSVSGYVVTLNSGAIEQYVEPAFWRLEILASTAITVSIEDPSDDLTITVGSVSGTISAGAGRQSVTITSAVGDTGDIPIRIALAAGTATFGRVKAELGSSMTDWLPRSETNELLMCQRYFAKSYEAAVMPGTATFAGMIEHRDTIASQGAKDMLNVRFAVPMRVAPAITWYSPSTGAINRICGIHSGNTDYFVTNTNGTSTRNSGNAGVSASGSIGSMGGHISQQTRRFSYVQFVYR